MVRFLRHLFVIFAASSVFLAPPRVHAQTPDPPAKIELVQKLHTLKISLDFQDIPIEEAIAFIAELTDTNLVLDPKIFLKIPRERLRVHLVVRDLPAWDALSLLLNIHGLQASFRRGVLFISTPTRILGKPKVVVYDIRDLLLSIRDFPGPQIRLKDASQDNPTGPLFGEPEESSSPDSPGDIVDLVKMHTGGSTWENRRISISSLGGHLIVVQYASVHKEIQALLQKLR
ncbi:MAG: hypothetical protein QF752_00270 [Planctomycetota bacterium]|jgi:hypothetical protein|nr:hypothetical protein [Planctomycetota bacterium]